MGALLSKVAGFALTGTRNGMGIDCIVPEWPIDRECCAGRAVRACC